MKPRELLNRIADALPARVRGTAMIRGYGLLKIRPVLLAWPTVEELTEERCVVRIPLNMLTRNHVGSMYIGMLTAGADLACGLPAMEAVRRSGAPVTPIFKDIKGDFLRRADSDVYFECKQGVALRELAEEAVATGKRCNLPAEVTATVRTAEGSEVVARFTLTISLKRRDA